MDLFNVIVWIWIVLAILTFCVLTLYNIKAPYGRHIKSGWGKTISNRWGWFWMELPALILMPLLSFLGSNPRNDLSFLLAGVWVLHYSYRTLVFPFKIRTTGKKIPLLIVLSGIFFNGINGFLNGYYLGYQAPANASLFSANVGIGMFIFLVGMIINRISDHKLIELRNNHVEYQVPQGWLFKYVSCPNHLGEIIEWTGFAIMAWNLPAVSFAIWTYCNLIPRTINHHQWYKQHFSDYPDHRKILIPFIW